MQIDKSGLKTGIAYLKQDIKNVGLGLALGIGVLVIMKLVLGEVCGLYYIFGIPCPACGLTRAGISVLTFHWTRAWDLNPCIFLIGIVFLYFCVSRYLLGKKVKWIYSLIAITLFVLFAVYAYRIITVFPGEAPMNFYEQCLLRQWLHK